MTGIRRRLGNEGEAIAGRYLRRRGYRVLARNYVCPLGEIDLICAQADCVVFVEVKTRTEDTTADPETNITPAKQRRLQRIARYWLAAHGDPDCACRFDAVSVVRPVEGVPHVRHIIDAFTGGNA